MSREPRYWTIAVPLLFGGSVPGAQVYTSRSEAAERARQENKYGEYHGRGVQAVRCDASGRAMRNAGGGYVK